VGGTVTGSTMRDLLGFHRDPQGRVKRSKPKCRFKKKRGVLKRGQEGPKKKNPRT